MECDVVTDGSMVKFSWLAFQQPNIYVDQKETDARIHLYYDIVNGNRKNKGLFKVRFSYRHV